MVVLRHVAAPRSDDPKRRVESMGFLIFAIVCVDVYVDRCVSVDV